MKITLARGCRSVFLLAAALLATHLHGQQPTIRTTVPLVTVPVSVADRHGGVIAGLDASDFLLLDDGKPRPVRVDTIDSGLAPIALVTLIQTSDITLSALAKIRKAGVLIPEAVVGANGEAAILTFDDHIKVAQDFTTDADAISRAFHERFRFETKPKLENDLIRLGTEIHSRYLLSFTPDLEQAPRFHHLELQIKNHPDALIRARPGYWAMTKNY